MKATLKRVWELVDASSPNSSKVERGPGDFELERIPNPLGHNGNWLVIKGTMVGMAEGAWRQWKNGELVDNPHHLNNGKPIDWGDFEIIIND